MVPNKVLVFEDDDSGYLDWIATRPEGFVVNANRRPTAAYLVLHRATCRTISGDPTNGRAWTADYLKVCSGSLTSIERWAQEATGGAPSLCGTCRPE